MKGNFLIPRSLWKISFPMGQKTYLEPGYNNKAITKAALIPLESAAFLLLSLDGWNIRCSGLIGEGNGHRRVLRWHLRNGDSDGVTALLRYRLRGVHNDQRSLHGRSCSWCRCRELRRRRGWRDSREGSKAVGNRIGQFVDNRPKCRKRREEFGWKRLLHWLRGLLQIGRERMEQARYDNRRKEQEERFPDDRAVARQERDNAGQPCNDSDDDSDQGVDAQAL